MNPEDVSTMSLSALTDHLVRKHHAYTREQGVNISNLLDNACETEITTYPELPDLRRKFGRLRMELENHLLKEEKVLFPYIALMESSLNFGQDPPRAHFGSTRNPIAVMLQDHADAEELLKSLRSLTDDYNPPAQASATYEELLKALAAFEDDLNEHMRLENDILFPKAIEMEEHGAGTASHAPDVKSDLPILTSEDHH